MTVTDEAIRTKVLNVPTGTFSQRCEEEPDAEFRIVEARIGTRPDCVWNFHVLNDVA
jgi:hypothetical protein